MDVDVDALAARMQAKFKKAGRPKGAKNKPPSLAPPAWKRAAADIKHSDPQTLVDRQLVLAEWMQGSLTEEVRRRLTSQNPFITVDDVKRFDVMTTCLATAIRTLKGVNDLAEEMSKRMTGEQLLEAAVDKIEAQEPQTIRWAIKRLKATLERRVPKAAPLRTATDALAELVDSDAD
jgi:hypothetical protein